MCSKNFSKLILFLILFFLLSAYFAFADEKINAEIKMSGPSNPSISRFIGFDGVIMPSIASKLYRYSLKLYINGVDRSLYLQSESTKSGEIYFSYDPIKELPTGRVNILLKALGTDNNSYSQKIFFVVNPGADKDLAACYRAAQGNPSSVTAHINFAKAYEKKYMFKDAAYEYRRALTYDPRSKTALDGWKRVFTSLDRKSITIRDITIDVSIDEGIDMLGNLMLFKTRIINNSHEIVKFDPADTLLIVDNDYQVRPLDNFMEYPDKALDKGAITTDQFARMKYYLGTKVEVKSFKPIEKKDIQPSVALEGYLAYELKYPKVKYLNLWIKTKTDPKIKVTFRIPFKKP